MFDGLFRKVKGTSHKIGNLFSQDKTLYRITKDEHSKCGRLVEFLGCSEDITNLCIPDHIGGVKITSIGESAFSGCSSLTSVNIPGSVESIGESAFSGCSSLISVNMPNSIKTIEKETFKGCSSLTSVNIPGSVESIGEAAFRDCSSLTSVNMPNSIKTIEKETFKGCSSLTSVNIPGSVESIGEAAFRDCSSLTSVNIPGSVESIREAAFRDCSSLTSVNIPKRVQFIRKAVFSGCSSLTSVNIPGDVQFIRRLAFRNCSSLISVTIPDSVSAIGDDAFSYSFFDTAGNKLTDSRCIAGHSYTLENGRYVMDGASYGAISISPAESGIVISDSNEPTDSEVESEQKSVPNGGCGINPPSVNVPVSTSPGHYYCFIKDNLSYRANSSSSEIELIGCNGSPRKIKRVSISKSVNGNNVIDIGDSIFEGYILLETVIMPDGVRSIGRSAFSGCISLTSVDIPKSVESIGEWAFSGCSSLTSVDMPDGIASIGKSTFFGCSSLTSVGMPDGMKSLGPWAFCNCSSLTSVDIPKSVESIGESAFCDCSSLISVNMPDSVRSIGSSAFSGCSSLTSVDIPKSVESIESKTFSNCSSLTSVNMPDSVESIGEWAFYRCRSLASVDIPDSVQSIRKGAFSGCSSLITVNIPDSVKSIEDDAFSYSFFDIAGNELTDPKDIAGHSYALKGERYIMERKPIRAISISYPSDCEFINETKEPADPEQSEERKHTVMNIRKKVGTEFSQDGITYLVTKADRSNDDYQATVRSCSKGMTYVSIPNQIADVRITSIDCKAFEGCTWLKTVIIPDSVRSIGASAFYYCISLTSLDIPDSVINIAGSSFEHRFFDTAGNELTDPRDIAGHSYTLENGRYVMEHKSNGADSISPAECGISVSIVNGSAASEDEAEQENVPNKGCDDRTPSANGSGAISPVCSGEFESDGLRYRTKQSSPDEVELIGFNGSAVHVNIPETVNGKKVTGIGASAFEGCSSLTSAELPETVKDIGDGAFFGCGSLTSVSIPDGVERIGSCSFKGCDSLNSVHLPDSVTEIGNEAFAWCGSIVSMNIPSGVERIGMFAFDSDFFDQSGRRCTSVKDIVGHSYTLRDGRYVMDETL